MPGLFGAVGCPQVCGDRLRSEFKAVWGEIEALEIAGGVVGGHSHGPIKACHVCKNGVALAVDGEAEIYRSVTAHASASGPAMWQIQEDSLSIHSTCEGNIVVVHPDEGRWWVSTGLTGLFPVYYSTAAGGLLFSTLFLPLVRAVQEVTQLEHDPLGLLERMRSGYMLAARTYFKDVHRLLPGQCLTYDCMHGQTEVREQRTLWPPERADIGKDGRAVADLYWSALCGVVDRTVTLGSTALMMSGGWDSRTILAALHQNPRHRLVCYSHGDLQSREMAITRRLCAECNVPLIEEPLTAAVYEPAFIDMYFPRTETAAFPHWLEAGATLAKLGVATVASGMYGEVVGGQYSGIMPNRGRRKLLYAAGLIFGSDLGGGERRYDLSFVRDLLNPPPTTKPWYLSQDVWDEALSYRDAITADAEWALERLVSRGARDQDQLIEAFLIEHRAAQNPGEQVLSCRASVDVSMPFADSHLLSLATQIPMRLKLQNSLNRLMLLKYAPGLTKVPTAATLVPASAPIFIQELSRVTRRVSDSCRWRIHSLTGGFLPFPRSGWWQLEFLRDGKTFGNLLDDLKSDIWDKKAIRTRISENARDGMRLDWRSTTALLSQHMLRIATIDRMLR